MVIILIRTLFFYILLTLAMKLMGKRQIGEMELSELVTTVLISELAVFPITDTDIPLMYGLLPVLLIASLEVIISFACQRSKKMLILLNGNPLTLYENDAFIEKNLIKSRISTDDVDAQVRINGYESRADVKRVILERTGKMSVIGKDSPTENQSGE